MCETLDSIPASEKKKQLKKKKSTHMEVRGGKQPALQTALHCFSLGGFPRLFCVHVVFDHHLARYPSLKFNLSPVLGVFLLPHLGLVQAVLGQLSVGREYFL
jgi:hypothetical protein